jgi:hypothetical protein
LRRVNVRACAVYGVLLTWLCLRVASLTGWPVQHSCELGHCAEKWWTGWAIFGYVFGLPIMLGALNFVAWRSWPAQRWAGWFVSLTLLIAVLHLAGRVV